MSACWCSPCIRGIRQGAFKGIQGCYSGESLEYKVLRRKDIAWVTETESRTRSLACDLSRTLKSGDVIAYDPRLLHTNRRSCRFNIGEVISIQYPYDIFVNLFESNSNTQYVRKNLINCVQIHSYALRYKFANNPMIVSTIQNKTVYKLELTDEIFATITKNFYNGN